MIVITKTLSISVEAPIMFPIIINKIKEIMIESTVLKMAFIMIYSYSSKKNWELSLHK